jgi:hypothetical protein
MGDRTELLLPFYGCPPEDSIAGRYQPFDRWICIGVFPDALSPSCITHPPSAFFILDTVSDTTGSLSAPLPSSWPSPQRRTEIASFHGISLRWLSVGMERGIMLEISWQDLIIYLYDSRYAEHVALRKSVFGEQPDIVIQTHGSDESFAAVYQSLRAKQFFLFCPSCSDTLRMYENCIDIGKQRACYRIVPSKKRVTVQRCTTSLSPAAAFRMASPTGPVDTEMLQQTVMRADRIYF